MTDNEIIQTFCCELRAKNETISELNEQIEYWQRGYNDLLQLRKEAQAEIDKLNAKNILTISERNAFRTSFYDVLKQLKTAKSEAVREFVDKLKEVSSEMIMCNNGTSIPISYSISSKKLDSILKEMVGDENKN